MLLRLNGLKGKRSSLFIPGGRARTGWKVFEEALERVLSAGFAQSSSFVLSMVSPSPTFSDSFANVVQKKWKDSFSSLGELVVENNFFFDTSSYVLVVILMKENAYDSWFSFERGVKMRFGDQLMMQAFCVDTAIVLMDDFSLTSINIGQKTFCLSM